ncbi:MAG TPA: cyclic nucleotide-binding domain-containing protein [Syntrophorhabdaceae bacterium]|nr:cyclic nucleotide-binding domain-containing protein [Syntrophorhabdaceae bacterium]
MKITLAERIQLLKGTSLFRTLKEEELKIILLTAEDVIYESGEVIVNEGEEGSEAYIIYTGSVEIYRKAGDGRLITLNKLGPGGMFGEFALFRNGIRTASAKALEETFVSVFSREKVYEIIRTFPDIAIEMLKSLTERFSKIEDRLIGV